MWYNPVLTFHKVRDQELLLILEDQVGIIQGHKLNPFKAHNNVD
jgi:hypothetical protein